MKKLILIAGLFLLATAGFAHDSGLRKEKALRAEYSRLLADYSKAAEIFYKPLDSLDSFEDMQKARLDLSRTPQKLFLPRMERFAGRAASGGHGKLASEVWFDIFMYAENAGLPGADSRMRRRAFEELVTKHANSAGMESLVGYLRYAFIELGEKRAPTAEAHLVRIEGATNSEEVKAAVLFARATISKEIQWPTSKTLSYLETITERYPKSRVASRVPGEIYEIVHLRIGRVAPDFVAEDQDGVKFKLSDYRGRVVVLEFWGFW